MSVTASTAAMLDDDTARVHFDDACVLIPEPVPQSRMPRLVKKSYSLPLWRKRSNSQSPVDHPQVASSPPAEHSGVSFTVSVPSFAKSRSPTRGEHCHEPLVSCLLNGPNGPPAHRHHAHARRPSLSTSPQLDLVTVPLRPCCPECFPITEECLRVGDEWKEKFTRAARRRRNSSAESRAHAHVVRHRRVCDDLPGFGAIVSVDEIDKRRGTSSADPPVSPAPATEPLSPIVVAEEGLLPSISRRETSFTEPPAPIEEVVEDDVFPQSASEEAGPSIPHTPPLSRRDIPLFLDHIEDAPTQGSTEEPLTRESVYYTPLESPATPPWESPVISTSSQDSSPEASTPETPPLPSHSRAIPIPSNHKPSMISNFSLSSFEFVHHSANRSPEVEASSSPELGTSPTRRRLHMPNLPGPGSFLRAGAEMFRGVGTVPLSV